MEKLEARFKQLLNRPQSSADIEPASLPETSLPYTYDQLLTAASATNPEIAAMKKNIEKQQLQIDMARKDFYPDFNVQYMWQRTDPTEFRAYYSFTFSARVPSTASAARTRSWPRRVRKRAGQKVTTRLNPNRSRSNCVRRLQLPRNQQSCSECIAKGLCRNPVQRCKQGWRLINQTAKTFRRFSHLSSMCSSSKRSTSKSYPSASPHWPASSKLRDSRCNEQRENGHPGSRSNVDEVP